MLCRLMPELAEDMDTSRRVDYLEQELREVTAAIDGPKQNTDLLVKIPMKRGGDIWLALHIEIQGEAGGDLPERMFFYNSMLRVKHLKNKKDDAEAKKPGGISDVVSLAILTAQRPTDEDEHYERNSYSNELRYKYPAVKLWELDETALAESENPFEWALLSGLYVIKSGRNDVSRVAYLKALGDMLDAKGWSREEKYSLYKFMEAVLRPASAEQEREYRKWVTEKRKGDEKVYISIAEEIGMEQGILIGIEKGRQEGMEKGRQEGMEKGIEKGRYQEKFDTARNLLALDVDVLKIAMATDLPMQLIEKIQAEL